jgi:hypothetical protein
MGRNRHKTRNDNHPPLKPTTKPQPQSTQSQSIYSLNSLGENFDESLWDELKNLAMNSENEQSKTTNKTNDK